MILHKSTSILTSDSGADPSVCVWGGGGLGCHDPPFWGTPKLHKEGTKNVVRVCLNTTRFTS